MSKRKTERGFAVYDEGIPTNGHGTLRVQESSLAGEGAHVWLFFDHYTGRSADQIDPQLNVAAAKRVIAALSEFVRSAESDELTEPATVEETPA